MKNWRSVAVGLLTGTLTGIAVGLGGFFLATIPRTLGMGSVMFILVPACAGFAIALVTRQPNTGWAAMLLAALASLTILVALGREGILCALLAVPWLGFGLAVGSVLGHLFRRHVLGRLRHPSVTTLYLLLFTPLLISAGHQVESRSPDSARRETVSTSVRLQAQPEEVWANIQSIDSVAPRGLCLCTSAFRFLCAAPWREKAWERSGYATSKMDSLRRLSPNGHRRIPCDSQLIAQICRVVTGWGSKPRPTNFDKTDGQLS